MKVCLPLMSASVIALATACSQPANDDASNYDAAPASGEGSQNTSPEAAAALPGQNVLSLRAVGLEFEGPDTVEAGWTTIELENVSGMTHFAIVERLPEGITTQIQSDAVALPFQEGMDLIAAGDMDGAMAAFGRLPEWFADIVFLGGPGLVTGDTPVSATVFLEPGIYSIECYVKTNGVFHSYNPEGLGMYHQVIVTESGTETVAPEPTAVLDVSNTGYSLTSGAFQAGDNTIQVNYSEQTTYSNFVGHDVHVVRMDDAEPDAVIDWMNWTVPGAFETPAPAEFVGGLNEMPAGTTGYFSVNLEPDNYALVAEIPDADESGHFLEFEVGEP